jgi:type IV secretory pathway VirB3-like protein
MNEGNAHNNITNDYRSSYVFTHLQKEPHIMGVPLRQGMIIILISFSIWFVSDFAPFIKTVLSIVLAVALNRITILLNSKGFKVFLVNMQDELYCKKNKFKIKVDE